MEAIMLNGNNKSNTLFDDVPCGYFSKSQCKNSLTIPYSPTHAFIVQSELNQTEISDRLNTVNYEQLNTLICLESRTLFDQKKIFDREFKTFDINYRKVFSEELKVLCSQNRLSLGSLRTRHYESSGDDRLPDCKGRLLNEVVGLQYQTLAGKSLPGVGKISSSENASLTSISDLTSIIPVANIVPRLSSLAKQIEAINCYSPRFPLTANKASLGSAFLSLNRKSPQVHDIKVSSKDRCVFPNAGNHLKPDTLDSSDYLRPMKDAKQPQRCLLSRNNQKKNHNIDLSPEFAIKQPQRCLLSRYNQKKNQNIDLRPEFAIVPNNSEQVKFGQVKVPCALCKSNKEPHELFNGHTLKKMINGKYVVTCPVLRRFVCPRCNATGEDAHTITYCPLTIQENQGVRPQSIANSLKQTKRMSSGRENPVATTLFSY